MIPSIVINLTPEMGIKMAKRYGVDFTLAEANIIVHFLKEHRYELKKENKDKLLAKGKPLISQTTYRKVETLLNKIL